MKKGVIIFGIFFSLLIITSFVSAQTCPPLGYSCSSQNDCCSNSCQWNESNTIYNCVNSTTFIPTCSSFQTSCVSSSDCCPYLECRLNVTGGKTCETPVPTSSSPAMNVTAPTSSTCNVESSSSTINLGSTKMISGVEVTLVSSSYTSATIKVTVDGMISTSSVSVGSTRMINEVNITLVSSSSTIATIKVTSCSSSPAMNVTAPTSSPPTTSENTSCTPEYFCAVNPSICPEGGVQTELCTDLKCKTKGTEKTISCSPGICTGCNSGSKCLPYGFRIKADSKNWYCDMDSQLKEQKTKDSGGNWAACQNNFECASNICTNDECVDVKALTARANQFGVFLASTLCKILHPLNNDNYNTCVYNFFK